MSKIKDLSKQEIVEMLNTSNTPQIKKDDFNYITNIIYELLIENYSDISKYKNILNNYLKYILLNQIKTDSIFNEELQTIVEYFLFDYPFNKAYIFSDILDSVQNREKKMLQDLESIDVSDLGNYGTYLLWRVSLDNRLQDVNTKQLSKIDTDSYIKFNNSNFFIKFYYILIGRIDKKDIEITYEDLLKTHHLISANDWYEELIKKDSLNPLENDFLEAYIKVILSRVALFNPKELLEDQLIIYCLGGRLKNTKYIKDILHMISPEIFMGLIKNRKNDVLYDLVYHYQYELKLPDNLLKEYILAFIEAFDSTCLYSNFYINHLHLLSEKDKVKRFSWLDDERIAVIFKELDKNIKNGNSVNLDVSYVCSFINNYYSEDNKVPFEKTNFGANLVEALQNNTYYNEKDRRTILKTLKQHGYLDLFSSPKPDYNEITNFANLKKMVETSFYRKEVIPYDLAVELLKMQINENNRLNTTVLKSIIISIIVNGLKYMGIDIEHQVFFTNNAYSPNRKRFYGAHELDDEEHTIYIDEISLTRFVKLFSSSYDPCKACDVFRVIFHEMTHAIQFHDFVYNMDNYALYEQFKDHIISAKSSKYYEENYRKLGIELDARIKSYRMTIKFLADINEQIAYELQNKFLADEKKEALLLEEKIRRSPFNANQTIDVDEIFDLFIKGNTQILESFPVFRLEYHMDGQKKTVSEMFEFARVFGYMDLLYDYMNKKTPTIDSSLYTFLSEKQNDLEIEDFRIKYYCEIVLPYINSLEEETEISISIKNLQNSDIMVSNVGGFKQ